MGSVKTTIEIPDPVFRRAKSFAAAHGLTLKQFFTEAIEARIRERSKSAKETDSDPPWMKAVGGLTHLKDENRRILQIIEQECERIDPEGWK